ncbi:arylsulfatase [Rhodohalobacter mucosus]|uniref:Sulfatase n=1 Tax=Rhodohalobacter mucosus TaxID=2079485 RepID=A0A316TLP1_9BACT|nr:arylsulfatase [Rhodohalobacter mucosus]PWN05503.1 sulfatase [Rhodohalobacter mucosus]
MTYTHQFFATFTLLLFLVSGCNRMQKADNTPSQPNILLIVADDFGYTDLSAFGGDIDTPNLDALIENGITFSGFHTAPFCAVTRAMLLSGNDNHIAGMGSQDLRTGVFGYEGHLSDRIVPVPQLLKDAGYSTGMAGKWHLGKRPADDPSRKGFGYSFILQDGGGNHYSDRGIFPTVPVSVYTENGDSAGWPEGAYSTDLYTDKLISYINEAAERNRPFFSFAAYTTPHWPLQVDPEYWKKYEGQYDDGYEALRLKRFNRMKELGFLPEDEELPELHPRVEPWDSLTAEEQRAEARKMELYAGMVDNMDHNIGRLIDHLKEIGEYDNTLILFLSDNGAAAEDFYHHTYFGPFLKEHYTEEYSMMGMEESFISYGPQWAEAGASPFKYFKGYTTQGGMNTPLVISGPGVGQKGEVVHAFTTLMDLAPTFYEYAGVEYPESYGGREVYPLRGASLMPLLSGERESVHTDDYVFPLEHRGFVQIRKGNWKLVNIERPFDEANFELYDLSNDRGEQNDVKDLHPDVYRDLLNEWYAYRDEVQVRIPTPEPGEGL